ncbi:hypothetical protein [Pseudomonas sp. PS02290]|uniref:hypothetical protein n=1 Tax=Pseudomonas sp. PS02290 TaxID=2991430 RepID=UPI00249A263B|nr:hypothetical protein [Pseudomonas sp. PS02290]
MSAEKELAVVPPKEKALQIFQTPNGLDPYLQIVRDKIDAFVPDVTTRKGREAIASIAYTVARSKTALDNRGKELVAELKEIPKLIDAERKRMRDTLDTWQEEVRRPLTDWQAAEDARVDRHNDAIARIKDVTTEGMSAALIGAKIQDLDSTEIGTDWEEFEEEAHRAKASSLTALRAALAKQEQVEAEQAELARHRAEAEARAQQEREAQIAREAEERVRREAEASAQAEREATIRREAEAKAAAERRELELKLAAEQSERAAAQAAREKIEAEQRAAQQKIDDERRHQQALEQAEANRIAAEQRAEQERVAAEQRQTEAVERARLAEIARANAAADEIIRQQNAREADQAHKKTINRAALEAFVAGGMTEECARQAVTLIAQRKIPAVSISY